METVIDNFGSRPWTVKLGPTAQGHPAPPGRSGRLQRPSRPSPGRFISGTWESRCWRPAETRRPPARRCSRGPAAGTRCRDWRCASRGAVGRRDPRRCAERPGPGPPGLRASRSRCRIRWWSRRHPRSARGTRGVSSRFGMRGPDRRVSVAEVSVPDRNLACQIQLAPIHFAIQALSRSVSVGLCRWCVVFIVWAPVGVCVHLVADGGRGYRVQVGSAM